MSDETTAVGALAEAQKRKAAMREALMRKRTSPSTSPAVPLSGSTLLLSPSTANEPISTSPGHAHATTNGPAATTAASPLIASPDVLLASSSSPSSAVAAATFEQLVCEVLCDDASVFPMEVSAFARLCEARHRAQQQQQHQPMLAYSNQLKRLMGELGTTVLTVDEIGAMKTTTILHVDKNKLALRKQSVLRYIMNKQYKINK